MTAAGAIGGGRVHWSSGCDATLDCAASRARWPRPPCRPTSPSGSPSRRKAAVGDLQRRPGRRGRQDGALRSGDEPDEQLRADRHGHRRGRQHDQLRDDARAVEGPTGEGGLAGWSPTRTERTSTSVSCESGLEGKVGAVAHCDVDAGRSPTTAHGRGDQRRGSDDEFRRGAGADQGRRSRVRCSTNSSVKWVSGPTRRECTGELEGEVGKHRRLHRCHRFRHRRLHSDGHHRRPAAASTTATRPGARTDPRTPRPQPLPPRR